MSGARVCYATLLVDDSFFPGTLVLAATLRKHCPSTRSPEQRADLVVMIGPEVASSTRTRLRSLYDRAIEVEHIPAPELPQPDQPSWISSAYTKLNVWNLVEYEKVVYVDADAMVVDNIDELFELETAFAAAPDVFPPDKFNAGVLVLQPSRAVFEDMMSKTSSLTSYDGGDTGFLNAYFSDWYTRDSNCRLSFGYNAQRTLYWFTHATRSGYWDSIQPLKVIHFSSSPKPWDTSTKGWRGDLEALWWQEHLMAAMPAVTLEALTGLMGK